MNIWGEFSGSVSHVVGYQDSKRKIRFVSQAVLKLFLIYDLIMFFVGCGALIYFSSLDTSK